MARPRCLKTGQHISITAAAVKKIVPAGELGAVLSLPIDDLSPAACIGDRRERR